MQTYDQFHQSRSIKYIDRDFDTLRTALTEYLKAQFPDNFSDFSEESAGIAILEAVCYAGDILNFYIDKQFNELFLATSQEEKNVLSLAKNLGYKPRGKSSSICNNLVFNFNYPTSAVTTNYEFYLKTGTQFSTKEGLSTFELVDTFDTSTITSITRNVDVANNVTSASISGIKIYSGLTKTFQVKIGIAIPFLKVPIPDENILEIFSVSSSDGYQWYEVDYLAQENQFVGTVDSQSDSAATPYILTLKRVPRRFQVEHEENNKKSLRFGSGILGQSDADFIPNPEDFILPPILRGTVSGFSPTNIDPADFINTGTLGSSPSNCTMTIKYRTGGGLRANAATKTISQILQKNIEYKVTGNTFDKSVMEATFSCSNLEPALGGEDEQTLDEIKYNASAFYATQNRIITLQDYIVRCYSMPPKFGTIFRATAMKDPNDKLGIKLAILSRNSDGTLTAATSNLKINLANYLQEFRSLSENINITDGSIINLGLNFSIITDGRRNEQQVLAECLDTMIQYFDIRKWNMGQSISISQISKSLTNVSGVLAVPNIYFSNKTGVESDRTYSSTQFNVDNRTKNYIIICDPNSVFEIKHPKFDIRGNVLS